MKALVIAPQPFFTSRGTPFSVYYRTLITVRLGVDVDLLTYGEGQNIDVPGVRLIRIPRFKMFGSVPIGPSFLKAFLDCFLFLWTVRLLLTNRYAFVHAHEESIILCRFLKPIFGFKLVYDMHSSLPQQLKNFHFTNSRLLIGFFNWLERSCLRSADAVITICPALAQAATAMMRDPDKHFLIENSLFGEVRLIAEEGRNTKDDPLSTPNGNQLILYAGTFEPYQGLELLLRGFASVKHRLRHASLLLLGGTPEQVARLQRLSTELQITRACMIRARVSPARAREHAQSADLVVSPRIHGTNTPLKIYEALANGAVMVATRIPSHTQVLNEDVAVLVDPEPNAIGEGLVVGLLDKERRNRISLAAKQLYEKKYSAASYEEKMSCLLQCLGITTQCAE